MENPFLSLFSQSFDSFLGVLPIILPVFIIWRIIVEYVDYARQKNWNSQKHTLLEIIPPSDVKKSPAAMELFLISLHQTGGESTWIKKYIDGATRAWFSLEIVSFGGQVHFYIWMQTKYKRFIESQLHAQYPGIETRESEDYAQIFDFDPSNNELFGIEFGLGKPDPYPIKTYVDYALDTQDKEDLQIDPITPMIELLASLNPGEFMWFQYIVRAHKKEDPNPDKWFGDKIDNWEKDAVKYIEELRDKSVSKLEDSAGKKVAVNQTEGQKRKIVALERSISKLAFDVGIRALYMADKDSFDGINRGVLSASLKQFNSAELNGFKGIHATDFDFPWQDFGGHKLKKLKYEILEQYKDRKYFFSSLPGTTFGGKKKRKSMVLNTEELATIFHFPGKVSKTTSLQRVESRKVGPPLNLPI